MADERPFPLVQQDEIQAWLDKHGRTGDPALDGLRYAAAHAPIDVRVIQVGARAD